MTPTKEYVMNPVKLAIAKTVIFVQNHQLPIAIAATAVTTAVIVKKTLGNQLEAAEQFIKDEGLFDKFLTTFEDDI